MEDDIEALRTQIDSLLAAGRYQEATDRVAAAGKAAAEDFWLQTFLGSALNALGRSEAALAAYQTALRLNPHSADALHNVGAQLMQLGRDAEALLYFDAALRLNPDHPGATERTRRLGQTIDPSSQRATRPELADKPLPNPSFFNPPFEEAGGLAGHDTARPARAVWETTPEKPRWTQTLVLRMGRGWNLLGWMLWFSSAVIGCHGSADGLSTSVVVGPWLLLMAWFAIDIIENKASILWMVFAMACSFPMPCSIAFPIYYSRGRGG